MCPGRSNFHILLILGDSFAALGITLIKIKDEQCIFIFTSIKIYLMPSRKTDKNPKSEFQNPKSSKMIINI
jgi:hypothetical protein